MSSDIDIEEHDVMANAQGIYPDLSIVKFEILDFDYEEYDYEVHAKPPHRRQVVESGLIEIENADSTTDMVSGGQASAAPATAPTTLAVTSSDKAGVKLPAESLGNNPSTSADKLSGGVGAVRADVCTEDRKGHNTHNDAEESLSVADRSVGDDDLNPQPARVADLNISSRPKRKITKVKSSIYALDMDSDDSYHEDFHARKKIKMNSKTEHKVHPTAKPDNGDGVDNLHASNTFYGNKIILGFKKKANETGIERMCDGAADEVDDASDGYEPRCFHTKLVLRDWGCYLSGSKCYCSDCAILFPTINALEYHKMSSHSHLVALEEVSYSQDGYACEWCSSVLASKHSLVRHYKEVHKLSQEICFICKKVESSKDSLIKHLYEEHYNMKSYDCNLCSEQFNNKNDLEEHLYVHAKNRYKEIAMQNMPQENVTQKPEKTASAEGEAVPEETLNECEMCEAVFNNSVSLQKHKNRVHGKSRNPTVNRNVAGHKYRFTCKYCPALFGTYGSCHKHIRKYHKGKEARGSISKVAASAVAQRRTRVEPLKKEFSMSGVRNAVTKDILFKCAVCELHFMEHRVALNHEFHRDNGNVVHCKKCMVCIPKGLVHKHHVQHSNGNSVKIITSVASLANRILCQCPKCDVQFSEAKFSVHFNQCTGAPRKFFLCEVCCCKVDVGIKSRHVDSHGEYREPGDFIIVKYDTRKSVSYSIINHESGGDDDEEDTVVDVRTEDKVADGAEAVANLEGADGTSLLWKILYSCMHCSFIVDNYTLVVDHCHKHFAFKTKVVNSISKCNLCDLSFDEQCYDRHYLLHISNNKINNKTFMIISYNYKSLLRPEWAEHLTSSLADVGFDELTAGSIYRDVRNVKLELMQDGPQDHVVYMCAQCKLAVHKTYVVKHVTKYKSGLCKRMTSYCKSCKLCQVHFPNHSTFVAHQRLHEEISGMLRVVTFNRPADVDVNKALAAQSAVSQEEAIVVYQCRNCELIVNNEYGTTVHMNVGYDCSTVKSEYIACPQCNLLFDTRKLLLHLRKHNDTDFRKENFKIVPFGVRRVAPEADADDTVAAMRTKKQFTLYRCYECRRCLVQYSKTRIHTCKSEQRNRTCPHCRLLFSRSLYSRHMKVHRLLFNYNIDNINVIDFNPRDRVGQEPTVEPKVKQEGKVVVLENHHNSWSHVMYQCKKCNVSVSKAASAERHQRLSMCTDQKKVFKCPHCHLLFHCAKKWPHLKMHKNNPTFKRKNFKIVLCDSNTTLSELIAQGKSTTYGCHKCGTTFYTKDSQTLHLKMCNVTPRPGKAEGQSKSISEDDNGGGGSSTPVKYTQAKPQNSRKYIVYQCRKCKMCLHNPSYIPLHCRSCSRDMPKMSQCMFCKLLFSDLRPNRTHMQRHRLKDFTIDNIEIIPFDRHTKIKPRDEAVAKVGKFKGARMPRPDAEAAAASAAKTECDRKTIYNCSVCEVNFINEDDMKEHAEEDHAENVVGDKMACTICSYSFITHHMARHVDHQHSGGGYDNDFVVVTKRNQHQVATPQQGVERTKVKPAMMLSSNKEYINVLYKCDVCDLHFVSDNTITKHVMYKPHNKRTITRITKCEVCGLTFSTISYRKHFTFHHEEHDLRLEDLVIVNDIRDIGKPIAGGLHSSAFESGVTGNESGALNDSSTGDMSSVNEESMSVQSNDGVVDGSETLDGNSAAELSGFNEESNSTQATDEIHIKREKSDLVDAGRKDKTIAMQTSDEIADINRDKAGLAVAFVAEEANLMQTNGEIADRKLDDDASMNEESNSAKHKDENDGKEGKSDIASASIDEDSNSMQANVKKEYENDIAGASIDKNDRKDNKSDKADVGIYEESNLMQINEERKEDESDITGGSIDEESNSTQATDENDKKYNESDIEDAGIEDKSNSMQADDEVNARQDRGETVDTAMNEESNSTQATDENDREEVKSDTGDANMNEESNSTQATDENDREEVKSDTADANMNEESNSTQATDENDREEVKSDTADANMNEESNSTQATDENDREEVKSDTADANMNEESNSTQATDENDREEVKSDTADANMNEESNSTVVS